MGIIITLLNWIVGLLLLALLLRVILRWYDVSLDNRAMLTFLTVTEPVVKPFYRIVPTSGAYVRAAFGTGTGYLDIAALAAAMGIALAHFILLRVLGLIFNPPLWLLYPMDNLGLWLSRLLGFAVQIYTLLILARIILQWFRVSYTNPVMRFLWDSTEPLLAPIRRYLPTRGCLDFSPVIAVLLLSVAHTLIASVLQAIF